MVGSPLSPLLYGTIGQRQENEELLMGTVCSLLQHCRHFLNTLQKGTTGSNYYLVCCQVCVRDEGCEDHDRDCKPNRKYLSRFCFDVVMHVLSSEPSCFLGSSTRCTDIARVTATSSHDQSSGTYGETVIAMHHAAMVTPC